jgi:hypothetical protein
VAPAAVPPALLKWIRRNDINQKYIEILPG